MLLHPVAAGKHASDNPRAVTPLQPGPALRPQRRNRLAMVRRARSPAAAPGAAAWPPSLQQPPASLAITGSPTAASCRRAARHQLVGSVSTAQWNLLPPHPLPCPGCHPQVLRTDKTHRDPIPDGNELEPLSCLLPL